VKRTLGRSGIEVSAVGMGCWAIGGPWTLDGGTAGWSQVDDAESTRAIHAALELGANLFDTAANYGAGHSERILGAALQGRRDQVVIATKFGYDVDEAAREIRHYDAVTEESDVASRLRADLEKSLRRLGTDYVDVYLLHVWGLNIERALEARTILEDLVAEGKVRTYGWSTDRTDAIEAFSTGPGAGVLEQQLNIFDCDAELPRAGREDEPRQPQPRAAGHGHAHRQADADHYVPGRRRSRPRPVVRRHPGRPPQPGLARQPGRDPRDRDERGSNARPGRPGLDLGSKPNTVPIPGFRTVVQVEENVRAIEFGPLTPAQMAEIDRILGR